jgi:hypothetical protein
MMHEKRRAGGLSGAVVRALEYLCAELTATETKYPGTALRLIDREAPS